MPALAGEIMAALAELTLLLLWLRTLAWAALAVQFHRLARRGTALAPKPARVAVVIPAFDEEDQIGATIRALRRSDPAPAEIVVVDDGSSDLTAEIACAHLRGAAGASLLRAADNRGKASALNAGIAATQSELIATVDADTRLDPRALSAAAARLMAMGTAAVAFDLQVEPAQSLLSRIQAQEYAASLNFERAGQSLAGAISVLPGAATLFRRDTLGDAPFRRRTLTEDADLTLELVLAGASVTLETRALARTAAPAELRALFRQRVRWATGHIQCVLYHARDAGARSGRAQFAYLNFVVGTLSPFLSTVATACLAMFGSGPVLGLTWLEAVGVTALVVYAQRLLALLVGQSCAAGPVIFVLEPIFSGAVSGLSSYLAALRLSAPAANALRGHHG
jgi:cellulose synthase/poly-beta-1,6-N-acetylglucosamine synthase-like glycosyltransferase